MTWTVETLKEHFDALRESDQLALKAALASAEKGNEKAEAAQRAVNITQNEFRGTLKDQAATLMPIKEAEAKFDNLQKQITDLANKEHSSAGHQSGSSDTWKLIMALIFLTIAILGFIGFNVARN